MFADFETRLGHANVLLQIISAHGRHFFSNTKHERVAGIVQLGGQADQVFFVDDYSGKAIALRPDGLAPKSSHDFSHGGTLRSLVDALGAYVHTGKLLHRERIAPDMGEGRDLWGYGREAAAAVRAAAHVLPLFMPAEPAVTPDTTPKETKARRAP